MKSLRRSALLWTTALLAGVGLIAFAIAYEFALREAGDFLDGQLRQIALNAGDGLKDVVAPGRRLDPEDQFVIEIWNAAGETLRSSTGPVELPRAPQRGFSTMRAAGDDWRVYMVGAASVSCRSRKTCACEKRWPGRPRFRRAPRS